MAKCGESDAVAKFTHGNIRCSNVFVFDFVKSHIEVKLGDPGLADYYQGLNVSHPINEERFA